MKIESAKYKNIFAISVKTAKITALFLPDDGSKLVSLKDNETGDELLAQANSEMYKPLSIDGNYIESECSAFDDMFPTIDPFIPSSGMRNGVEYNDHGEICRFGFNYEIADEMLIMNVNSERLLYNYKKTISENIFGGLTIHYEIENNSNEDFTCLWAAHFMIAACDGGKVIVPYKEGDAVELMFSKDKDLGEKGNLFGVSTDTLTSKAFSTNGNAYKYYFSNIIPDGYCGYYNNKINRTLMLDYDKNKLPYLGIWINDGSFKEMHNIALEPCTVAFDRVDEALKRGQKGIIKANEIFEFDLNINIHIGEFDKQINY